eukprot:scaffold83830_cov51-Phaeocystis_antarctica.AAC.2
MSSSGTGTWLRHPGAEALRPGRRVGAPPKRDFKPAGLQKGQRATTRSPPTPASASASAEDSAEPAPPPPPPAPPSTRLARERPPSAPPPRCRWRRLLLPCTRALAMACRHRVAASGAWDGSLKHAGLQPRTLQAAASNTLGCSL